MTAKMAETVRLGTCPGCTIAFVGDRSHYLYCPFDGSRLPRLDALGAEVEAEVEEERAAQLLDPVADP